MAEHLGKYWLISQVTVVRLRPPRHQADHVLSCLHTRMRIMSLFNDDVLRFRWNVRSSSVVMQPVVYCEENRYFLETNLFMSTCFPIAIDYTPVNSLRQFFAFSFLNTSNGLILCFASEHRFHIIWDLSNQLACTRRHRDRNSIFLMASACCKSCDCCWLGFSEFRAIMNYRGLKYLCSAWDNVFET